jgi:hypothetical protein
MAEPEIWVRGVKFFFLNEKKTNVKQKLIKNIKKYNKQNK